MGTKPNKPTKTNTTTTVRQTDADKRVGFAKAPTKHVSKDVWDAAIKHVGEKHDVALRRLAKR